MRLSIPPLLFFLLFLCPFTHCEESKPEELKTKQKSYRIEQEKRCNDALEKLNKELQNKELSSKELEKLKLYRRGHIYSQYRIHSKTIECFESYIRKYGKKDPNHRILNPLLIQAYSNSSEPLKAIPLLDEKISTEIEKHGPYSGAVAQAFSQKGHVLRKAKAFDHAKKAFEKRIAIYTKLNSHSHIIAESHEMIAQIYEDKGDLKTAEAQFLKAIPFYKETYGDEHHGDSRLLEFYIRNELKEQYKVRVMPRVHEEEEKARNAEWMFGRDSNKTIMTLEQLKRLYENLDLEEKAQNLMGIIQESKNRPIEAKEILPRNVAMERMMRAMEVPIELHGIVLDQYQEPVAGANLSFSYRHFDPVVHLGTSKTSIRTTSDGRFCLSGIIGTEMFLKDIQAPKHEFQRLKNPRSFKFSGKGKRFKSSIKEPATFVLRKYGETTFLLKRGSNRIPKLTIDETQELYLDFTDGNWSSTKRLNRLRRPIVKAIASLTSKNGLLMNFTSLGEGSGVKTMEKNFYQAPKTGYQTSANLVMKLAPYKSTKEQVFYIAHKTSPPAYFSKYKIKVSLYDNRAYWDFSQSTNPFGERLLEHEPSYSHKVLYEFGRHAQEKLIGGEYASKEVLETISTDALPR